MSEKKVILTIGNVRIKEYDNFNVTVERHESYYNPIAKTTVEGWKFKGYSKSILSALMLIQRNELLIDKNSASDLKSYLKQVRESNDKLNTAIRGVESNV